MVENLGRIVGKLFLFILFLSCFIFLDAQVKLRALDIAGNSFQQACVGEPFMLEVEMIDIRNSMQVPTIVGLDRFVAKRTGLYMHTVNGKSMIKYSYRVRIDQPGMYEIGPAVITDHKKKQVSNVVTVAVGDQSIAKKTIPKKKEHGNTKEFLRLLVDNNNVVVGQKVPCALRFYYNNNSIELKQIGKPEISSGVIKNVEGPLSGRESIDGIPYKYIEWQWDLYPSQPGKITIPAYRVDFDVRPKRAHALGSFSLLFGPNAERKRVYSNAARIQVDPLPLYDGMVQAVGDFRKIEAQIKPAVVKEGEAMVLAIELEGDGDLEAIEIPELAELPKELKYYKSNSSIIEPMDKTTLPKKRFEFIVQGIACGEWEVPQQSFTYFDVHNRSYKTLQTVPFVVTIVPQTTLSGSLPSLQQKSKKEKSRMIPANSIYPINSHGPWYPVTQREPMSWLLFGFLSSIPVGLWLYQLLWVWMTRYWCRNQLLWWRKKQAFWMARKQLKEAIDQQDVTRIYHIFVTLIANCCPESNVQISFSSIKQQLYKKGLSENIIIMWGKFFTRATEYAFMTNNKNKSSYTAFFRQAEQWINRFEAIRW